MTPSSTFNRHQALTTSQPAAFTGSRLLRRFPTKSLFWCININ